MNASVLNGGIVSTVILPVSGSYLLFFNLRLTTVSTINYVNYGSTNWGISLVDSPTQGNITGTFNMTIVGSLTINFNYNYNGTPGIATGSSYFTAIRIA